MKEPYAVVQVIIDNEMINNKHLLPSIGYMLDGHIYHFEENGVPITWRTEMRMLEWENDRTFYANFTILAVTVGYGPFHLLIKGSRMILFSGSYKIGEATVVVGIDEWGPIHLSTEGDKVILFCGPYPIGRATVVIGPDD